MKRTLPLAAAGVAAALLLTSAVWAATDGDPAPDPLPDATTTTAIPAGAALTSTTSAPAPAPAPAASTDHDHATMDDRGTGRGGADSGDMDAGGTTDHAAAGHTQPRLAPLAERQARATAEERSAADRLAAETKAALAPYADVDAALAAGFVPNRDELDLATIHYRNPANRRDDRQLDPSHPEGLVYRQNPDGSSLLLGAVYTAKAGEPAPTPGGPMFSWHTHEECAGFFVAPGTCTGTFRMLHVWTADGVVDAFTQPFRAALRPSP